MCVIYCFIPCGSDAPIKRFSSGGDTLARLTIGKRVNCSFSNPLPPILTTLTPTHPSVHPLEPMVREFRRR